MRVFWVMKTKIEGLERRLKALQGPGELGSFLTLPEGTEPTPEEWASIDGDPARVLYYRVVDGRIRREGRDYGEAQA